MVRQTVTGLSVFLLTCSAGLQAQPAGDPQQGAGDVDKLMIIDCMLPGKVRRLGAGARYMSARRPIKTTAGDCEIRGGEYVAYDRASYSTSLQVWLPEAKAGDPKAQTYVGEMFEKGLGTTPDYETAVAWYTKAAEQGYSRAQMNLGAMYESGRGVPQDEAMALNWYRRATGLAEDDLVYSSEVVELETEVQDLRQELAASNAEVNQLRGDLSASQQRLTSSQLALDDVELELNELRYRSAQASQLGDSPAEVERLQQEISQKEAQLASSRQEVEQLRAEQAQQQIALASQVSALQEEGDARNALLSVERQKLADLEFQVTQLNGRLDARNADLEDANTQLEALRRQYTAQLTNNEAEQQASIEELNGIIERQRQELSSRSQSIVSLEQQLADNENRLASSRSALVDLEQQSMADASSRSEEATAQLNAERQRVAELQNEVSRLNQDLRITQQSVEQGNTRLGDLEQQLQLARSEQASSSQNLEGLASLIDEKQAELERKTLSASFLQQELDNQEQLLTQERSDFQQREQALQNELNLVQVEKDLMAQQLADAQARLASFEEQMQTTESFAQDREEEIRIARGEIEQLRQRSSDLEQDMAMMDSLRGKVSDQSLELAEARGQNEWLAKERDRLLNEVSRLQAQTEGIDAATTLAQATVATEPVLQRGVQIPPNVPWGEYHALLIGNSDYLDMPDLLTPSNDVRAMAEVLRRQYGFKVQVLENASRFEILETLNSYRVRLEEEDNFLIYYAGHGALDQQNDRGHWLPVDATIDSPANWISNETISDYINTMNAKHIMVIADSCYSGTLARTVRPNLNRGRSPVKNVELLKVLASTPSRTALTSGGTQPVMDGGGGGHSIFAGSLLNVLRSNEGVLLSPDLFSEVHRMVSSSQANQLGQVPAYDVIRNTGDMTAPFFFVSG